MSQIYEEKIQMRFLNVHKQNKPFNFPSNPGKLNCTNIQPQSEQNHLNGDIWYQPSPGV